MTIPGESIPGPTPAKAGVIFFAAVRGLALASYSAA